MTARTALEIYFNPDDIYLYIGEEEGKKDVWGVMISRGPRLEQHPYKLLLTSNGSISLSKEKALEIVETELTLSKKFGDSIFTTTEHYFLKALTCKDFDSKEDYVKKNAPVLEDSDIARIMSELRNEIGKEKHHSSPYQWDVWKERYPKKEQAV